MALRKSLIINGRKIDGRAVGGFSAGLLGRSPQNGDRPKWGLYRAESDASAWWDCPHLAVLLKLEIRNTNDD